MASTRVATAMATATGAGAVLDEEAAARLSRRFNEVFETFDAGDDLFSPDAFFDLNMPVWRFQIQGPEAFAAQLARISQGPSRIDILRTVPTATGFVTEHEEHQDVDGEDLSARRVWLCDLRDGRICDVTGYCSGEWNEELRARHAAEAPMIRK
ncbi:MAG TPA: nuclear transport factor 2 family protein, partial [Aeromicrobium sp.]|nr:nuclear transport factor 2 family protein [Aeromicrobium sp.]